MKHLTLRFPLLLILSCAAVLFSSCQEPPAAVAPFSDAAWEFTSEDILQAEGSDFTTYDSIYGGICYTYFKAYEGHEGTIKYMLDGEDRLMCIAWTYSAETEDELYTLYDQIQQTVSESNGDAAQKTDAATNYGAVWYREEGNIVISTMVTSSMKALQFAYLHPEVSSPEKD